MQINYVMKEILRYILLVINLIVVRLLKRHRIQPHLSADIDKSYYTKRRGKKTAIQTNPKAEAEERETRKDEFLNKR